ncbi:MAG: hypothetical protein ACYS47_21530, partial [Planctomycetota bacterium]
MTEGLLRAAGLVLLAAAIMVPVWGEEKDEGEIPVGKVVWLTDHKAASELAQREGKLIIIDMESPWGQKLRKETFPHPTVQALLQKFVPLRMNPKTNPLAKALM